MVAAVTASSQAAVDAGLEILRLGGNAVDAAVAAALVSCVADPCNTGIGGYGGYMVIGGPHRPAVCVRFGFWAPSSLSAETLHERTFPESGPAASAVPNVIAGLARGLEEFGSLDWATLAAPAIKLAAGGVIINATTQAAFEECAGQPFIADCFEFESTDDGAGNRRFRQPRLAVTLEKLARYGPSWFYEGPLGDIACRAWRQAGIDVSLADWRSGPEAVAVVPAARFSLGGHTVFSAPLGFTGSACLFAFLEAARQIASDSSLDDPQALARLAGAMASVWQYRLARPGGNDFDDIAITDWVDRALSHFSEPSILEPAPGHTAHLNVLDPDGCMVALTFTQGPIWFGGRWILGDSGVIMNAGMRNFSRMAPVVCDGRCYGVSNMTPTIMQSPTGAYTAIGSPGSRRIPSNVALVLARLACARYDLPTAVAAGRFHAEYPDSATYERARLPDGMDDALAKHFTKVQDEDWRLYFGPLTAITLGGDGAVGIGVDDRATPGFGAVA